MRDFPRLTSRSSSLFSLWAASTVIPTAIAAAQDAVEFRVGRATVQIQASAGAPRAAVRRDGASVFAALPAIDDRLWLRRGVFDPRLDATKFTGALAAPADGRLFCVQARTSLLPEYRSALLAAGFEVVAYWPMNAWLVRGDRSVAKSLAAQPWVRWVGDVAVGDKLDPDLHALVQVGAGPAREAAEYNIVLTQKSDRDRLAEQIAAIDGVVTNRNDGSVYLVARLTPAQLAQVAAFDTVLWIDAATPIGYDMDNARIQGGANYIETLGGYTGQGVRAEITEGLEQAHHDWTNPVLVQYDGLAAHGHCTSMIVGGNGSGNVAARGMMPDCQIIESGNDAWAGRSRYAVIQGSVGPQIKSMQQTASWGNTTTLLYTSVSAELDNALFDFDLATTQSQSNTGNQTSRPQAWAKNVISVGGVRHLNNSNPADDTWSTASIGPASDGRLKPEICAYYDSVLCGDLLGAAGYSVTDYYTGFNGTSSATPIVSGHLGLIQQMYTDGLFGNPLPQPATAAFRFENKSHMTTAKALLVNTAASYAFSGTTANLTRTHQGWGFPSLSRLFDHRDRLVAFDEYDVLQQGQSRRYYVQVRPGTPEFRATMVYADPEALPSAAIHRLNSVDLRVTRLADGTFWWGNNGLEAGNVSTSGGVANDRDTTEQVWLANPQPGIYLVEVMAPTIVADGHVETPALDVDYALVMHPIDDGYQSPRALTVDLQSTTPGELTVSLAPVPPIGWSEGFTFFSVTTSRPRGFGNFFGIEQDFLVDLALGEPAVAGGILHFTNAGAGSFPFAPFTFPPAIVSPLAGFQLDGMVALLDASGQLIAMSSIDRVTLQ